MRYDELKLSFAWFKYYLKRMEIKGCWYCLECITKSLLAYERRG